MSENEKNVPKRRFKEFENADAWEQRKVEDIGNIVTGSTPSTSDSTNYGGEYLFVSPADIKGNRYVKNTITKLSKNGFHKCRILKEGSTLFVSIGSTIGKVAQIKEMATTNQQINSIEPSEKYDNDFIYSAMVHKAKEIKDLAATQAVPIVNKTTFSEVNIMIPMDITEQVKIGGYFKKLDNLITLHQRKLEKIKALKKAYLTDMFPAEGERKPKLRFAGFNDDWEQRELGDITSYIKGFAFKSGDYKADGIRIIRVSDLSKDCVSEYVDKIYIDKNKAKQYINYMINNGDIMITTVGSKAELKESAVGRPIIFTENKGYLLNQNLVKIAPIQNYDSQFIYNQLLSERYTKYIADIQRGNANQANITISDLWEYSLQCPAFSEQKKIGQFFNKLDNLITIHQRKLEKLENIKKAYLNEMFI